MADGPAEDLYGIFINRVRRERPPEFLETVKGLVITISFKLLAKFTFWKLCITFVASDSGLWECVP